MIMFFYEDNHYYYNCYDTSYMYDNLNTSSGVTVGFICLRITLEFPVVELSSLLLTGYCCCEWKISDCCQTVIGNSSMC